MAHRVEIERQASSSAGGQRERRAEWLGPVVFTAGIAVLSFIAGSVMMYLDEEPAATVARSITASRALIDKATNYQDPVETDLWRPARTPKQGVTINDPSRTQPGMTLYTSGHAQKAFLIDRDGRVVHEWSLPFSQVWDKHAAVKQPQPDPYIYIEKSRVFPNGDLLALYVAVGDTPWGYGVVKMDKNSHVIWKYLAHAHHDLDVGPAGDVWVLTQKISNQKVPNQPHMRPPRIDDYLVHLSPDGKELQKIWLIGALNNSPWGRLLGNVPWFSNDGKGDYLHTNSVQVLNGQHPLPPGVTPGQVLVSFRDLSTVAIVDPEKKVVSWALRGSWLRQHDPQILPNGDLLLFDNEGHFDTAPGSASRVLEVNPRNHAVVWSYSGTPEHPFESLVRSSEQRLANGNTMIVEADAGRIFEVTPDDQIVWEYVNPVRGGPKNDRIPIIFWADRVDPNTFDAPFRDAVLAAERDGAVRAAF